MKLTEEEAYFMIGGGKDPTYTGEGRRLTQCQATKTTRDKGSYLRETGRVEDSTLNLCISVIKQCNKTYGIIT
jgi:hypothetical protein